MGIKRVAFPGRNIIGMTTKYAFYFIFSIIFTLFIHACAGLSTIPQEMEPTQVYQMLGANPNSLNLVILDVRTPNEYDKAHIQSSINIDYYSSNFRKDINKLDKNRNYLVYCRSGNRSIEARNIMRELGFKHVAIIKGGFIKWENEGLRTVTVDQETE